MELIVGVSIAFALAWFLGWLLHPPLREWLERPKHAFHANVKNYEQARRRAGDSTP